MNHIVTTTPANHSFTVITGKTILNCATEQGISLPYGCANGFCGSCKANLIAGNIKYPNNFQPELLSTSEIADGMILCCKATATSDLKIAVDEIIVGTIKPENFNTKVVAIKLMTNDVMLLTLTLGAEQKFSYYAGQYVNFLLDNNKSRAFSIANQPNSNNQIEFHIKHNQDGEFTSHLFNNEIKINQLIRINAPLGTFFIDKSSEKPVIFVATGTGFAPIKAIIEELLATNPSRHAVFYWGVRTEQDLYMNKLVQSWQQQNNNFNFVPVLSRAEQNWQGERGYVTEVICRRHPDLAKYQLYLTGSPAMINDAAPAFKKLGVPQDNIFSDAFERGE